MVTTNRDDKQNTSAKAQSRKLYTTMLTKFDCVVEDNETYVEADFKQLPGQEFYTATIRGKVTDIFKHIKLSKFAKKYLVWQSINTSGLKSHIRNRQSGNLCEQMPTKTFTAFSEAPQLFRSVLVGFGIMPLRKKDHGVVCCQQRSSGAQGQKPSQHARALPNRNILGHRQAEPEEDSKSCYERETVQGKLAFCGEQSGQGDCT